MEADKSFTDKVEGDRHLYNSVFSWRHFITRGHITMTHVTSYTFPIARLKLPLFFFPLIKMPRSLVFWFNGYLALTSKPFRIWPPMVEQ